MPKKINTKAIKYTSRDFDTIKEDLVDYAKRYYPNTYKDFNEASFGSLMLDTVAYVGDILSFYLDYQANESFLQTAVEYNNVLKHGRQVGFKFSANPSSYGILSLYILAPANTTGLGPDTNYLPILKKGSTFNSEGGAFFILNQNVDFANSSNEVRVGRVNSTTGIPTHYAIKAHGQVVSGRRVQETTTVGSFVKFLKLQMDTQDVTEVLSIVDSEGNQYYETEYLSQDVIYKGITNQVQSDRDGGAMEILKPFVVPRRFTVERERRATYLQFGASSDIKVNNDMIADPASVALKVHGKNYISDTSFDPTSLIDSDKFGVSPSNTTLTIISRVNDNETVNASAKKLNMVGGPLWDFGDTASLTAATVKTVRQSLEVENEEPIVGDITLPTTEELKVRIHDSFSTQNRAVTQNDYQSLVYRMPPQFGAIKRVRILRDENSFKRNLNIYIISEDSDGYLTAPNSSIKKNLKTWLQTNKMINDTIDILDAKIAGNYSDVSFDLEGGQSPDGRYIEIPKNVILELKYPDSDIKGAIV